MSYSVFQEVYTPLPTVEERIARTYVLPAFSAVSLNPGNLDICGSWLLGNTEPIALQLPLPEVAISIKFGTTRLLFYAFRDGYDVYNDETIPAGAELEFWATNDTTVADAIELPASVFDGSTVTLTFVQAT